VISVPTHAVPGDRFDSQAGDVGYLPFADGRNVENLGDEPLAFLEMVRVERFEDIPSTGGSPARRPRSPTISAPREFIE
jgi:hypothetical protein